MKTLQFYAEASLYISSGHYRTGEHALSLFRQTNRLRPALERGEVIVVRDCRPGWIKLGEGVCIPDPSLPGGGGLPPGPPEEPGAEPTPPPGGGPGGEPADKPDKPTREQKIGAAWRRRCAIDHYENPEKIIECCHKKRDECIKDAKGNGRREMACVIAGNWCHRPDYGGNA
jgi:hypothetical protein